VYIHRRLRSEYLFILKQSLWFYSNCFYYIKVNKNLFLGKQTKGNDDLLYINKLRKYEVRIYYEACNKIQSHFPSHSMEYYFVVAYTLGYNNLNNLVLPGCWWLQNLILRHNYKKQFSAVLSAFALRICIKWSKMVIHKFRIWCWFGSIEKVTKKLSITKGQGNKVFVFYYCLQKFLTYNFFG